MTPTWTAIDTNTGEIITDSQVSRVLGTHQQLFEELATVCQMLPERKPDGGYNWQGMTKTERGMLNRYAKELREAGRTVADVQHFGRWFTENDWRGQRGEPPMPTDVVKLMTRSLAANQGEDVAQAWLNVIKR